MREGGGGVIPGRGRSDPREGEGQFQGRGGVTYM